MTLTTRGAAETRRLGAMLGEKLASGDVVLLTGLLGAGKSELARGIAQGAGVLGFVPSPTFTMLNIYQGHAFALHHFDWYRIENPQELFEAGLDELIGGDSLTLIEWHERAPEIIPVDCLEIIIEQKDGDTRIITLHPRGAFKLPDLDLLEGE